jgi:hypothetical protein
MKQVPFNSDNYSLRFDRKYVLHNQDKKISLMQFQGIEKSLSKLVFARKFVKIHFSKILHVSLTLTSLFENEIFVGKQNSRI